MKYFSSNSIIILAILFLTTGSVLGGQGARNILLNSAQAWALGGARWAGTEDADTVLHNPAGAPFMEDGTHLHFSLFYAANDFTLKSATTGKEYSMSNSGVIPYLAATHKKDNWAAFFSISFPGGQGSGTFETQPGFDYTAELFSNVLGQTVIAKDQKMDFAGGKLAVTVGGAYKFNDIVAVGYGIRDIYAFSFMEGSAKFVMPGTGQTLMNLEMDQSTEGQGIGHMFCLLFNFHEKLKIGLRYDPEVKIETYTDVGSDDNSGAVDNKQILNSLPPAFCAGADYQFAPNINLSVGFGYYWQKGINGSDEPITDKWDNAYEVGASLRYGLLSNNVFLSKLELFVGFNYCDLGLPEEAYLVADTIMGNAYTYSLGAFYSPTPKMKLMFACALYSSPDKIWTKGDTMGLYERRHDEASIVGLVSLEYKI